MADRQARVKNRAPAPVQISAEQLIREASERQEHHKVGPTIKIHDAEEYQVGVLSSDLAVASSPR